MVTCNKGMLVLTPVYWDTNHLIISRDELC
jgi:hypothetical protein